MGGRGSSSGKVQKVSKKVRILNKNYKNIGKIDINKYTDKFNLTTEEVILTNNRKKHIIKKHPDVKEHIKNIKQIIEEPDNVYKENNKKDTIWMVKEINENIKITLKLNVVGNKEEKDYKNSVIQMQILPQKKLINMRRREE